MAGLSLGDRIPDFTRSDASGKQQFFYDVHHGQPVVLFLCGRATDAATRADLTALARPDQRWGTVTRVALVLGSPAELATLEKDLGKEVILLADDGALIQHLIGAPPSAMNALVLDENLRIVERLVRDGASSVWGPRSSPEFGVRMAFVADPEGHLIELLER